MTKDEAVAAAKFQSTPPAEARGDLHRARVRRVISVSIHSPREARGDLTTRSWVYGATNQFQSTPPAEARGDYADLRMIRLAIVFQSTPPAEARGDLLRPMS